MEDLKQICADVRADVVTTIGTLAVSYTHLDVYKRQDLLFLFLTEKTVSIATLNY